MRKLFLLGFLCCLSIGVMAGEEDTKTVLRSYNLKTLTFSGDKVNVTYQDASKEAAEFGLDELTVKVATKGDANGDGSVSITDAVSVVNYILTHEGTAFEESADSKVNIYGADTDESNSISITDAVGIVNIILNQPTKED